MPTKRGSRYWTNRHYPGVGRIYRSLRTTNKARARARESMLETLANRGQAHLVKAFAESRLGILELEEAFETQTLESLAEELALQDANLWQAGEEFLASCTYLAPSSRARYAHTLRHLRDFAGQQATVRSVFNPEALTRFVAYLLDQGLAKATVNRHLAGLSRISGFCVERGWLPERVKVKKLRIPKGRMRWLEPGDVALYLAHTPESMRPLFILLIGSGIDLGEAVGTKDNPERRLRACDLRLGDGEAWALIEDGKAPERARRVFLWSWVVNALRDHIERNGLSGSDHLFTWPCRTIQKAHHRACKSAGIADYRIKDHRHTAAVAMTRAGVPLDLVQKQLGHADIRQTMVYARFHPEYGDYRRYAAGVESRLAGEEDNGDATKRATPAVPPSWTGEI